MRLMMVKAMNRSIRILYDDGGFFLPYGGVARYFTEMIKRLPDGFNWKFGLKSTANLYLQAPPYNVPPHSQDVHWFVKNILRGHSFKGVSFVYKLLARLSPKAFPSGELANDRAFKHALEEMDFDVLHITGAHPVRDIWSPVVGKKPIVVTVYDLIPEIINGSKRVQTYRRKLMRDATHVIAISECTKRDLIRIYDVPSEKITVIHLGFLKMANVCEVEFELPRPYVLYVGRRDGYKNFRFLVDAISPLLRDGDLHLFCTGGDFSQEEKSLFEGLNISHKVHQRFVADEEMPDLFRKAAAFVYPSIYEGFGIPILDAFSAGCPVVLSNCSCFPEVGGDAALYFDDGDAETLRSHVVRLLTDGALRNELIEKGIARANLFTWEKCANETAGIYRKVYGDMS